ncbi:MAG: D-alanyl-D-alanine carboxypeptidase family protein [Eubacteriales bacterium]|nr:D-alanyl-D-alanine carboxypeptidase family protein [Eubacteriales bacterium]
MSAVISMVMSGVLCVSVTIHAGELSHVVQLIPSVVEMEASGEKSPEEAAALETAVKGQDTETKDTGTSQTAADGPGSLYALSAVLMDADSGRILYEKEGETARPMASTTKVMTCILALENAPGDDYVSVSANAASQPEVKLNMHEGEQYYLEDLLYSLMLKSHNDTAVAIAEHIGGSVEGFARMMNEKAAAIGCTDTHFVTPNGLDAKDGGGEHHTTAKDLALIMRYAIKNQTFLKITETRDYSFSDLMGSRQFSMHNANALLDMTDGVLSGKTGFTGNAGYCYVCACEKEGKTLIVSLLGCGWPGNKNYKWKDTMALLEYGGENFQYQTFWQEPSLKEVEVKEGVTEELFPGNPVYINCVYSVTEEEKQQKVLLKKGERVIMKVILPGILTAPVKKGQEVGEASYYLGDEKIYSFPIVADRNVEKNSYLWCADRVFHDFFH